MPKNGRAVEKWGETADVLSENSTESAMTYEN